jgi:hypothetical protein
MLPQRPEAQIRRFGRITPEFFADPLMEINVPAGSGSKMMMPARRGKTGEARR